MYEKSLAAAEIVLRTHQDPVVTVRKVWEAVTSKAQTEGFEVASIADFTAMLDADRRFQIIPARTGDEIAEQDAPEVDIDGEVMGQLGFFPEDRVRLTSIPMPKEEAIPEEEEEIASIRHRSFITQSEKNKIAVKVNGQNAKKKNKAKAQTKTKAKKAVKAKPKKIKTVKKKKKTTSKTGGKKRKK